VIHTTGPFEDTPNNKMRKIIASRLTESKREVPHFYTSQQVELDNIMKMRKKFANEHDVKVSVNDFVLRCCALALRDVPEVNATIDPATQQLRLLSSIDISVAVATPTGLITPIVFGADRLGLSEITEIVKDLATRARVGKLAPHEYQGGSFSVSNLGMFGVDEFSAVINPPQSAILAVGGGSRRVIPTPYVDDGSGVSSSSKTPAIRTLMTARLSADRRIVDESTASLFLSAFASYANEPDLMLL
jgi:pyruvate dehydrogenase E2 component (dihydrolipoamide acetyltransferase)